MLALLGVSQDEFQNLILRKGLIFYFHDFDTRKRNLFMVLKYYENLINNKNVYENSFEENLFTFDSI